MYRDLLHAEAFSISKILWEFTRVCARCVVYLPHAIYQYNTSNSPTARGYQIGKGEESMYKTKDRDRRTNFKAVRVSFLGS